MPATIKKGIANNNRSNAIVSNQVKDYSKDPVFVKKAEDAKAVLQQYGFPKAKKKS